MEHDDRDDPTDDERMVAHRECATAMLPEIAQQTRLALTEAGMDTSVFFLVPRSGDAIITFGTPLDPDDAQWNRVIEIVASIVRQTVGLDRVRSRPVQCATTDSVADHLRPLEISPVDGTAGQTADARSGAEQP